VHWVDSDGRSVMKAATVAADVKKAHCCNANMLPYRVALKGMMWPPVSGHKGSIRLAITAAGVNGGSLPFFSFTGEVVDSQFGQVKKVVGDFSLQMDSAEAKKLTEDPKAKTAFALALATSTGLPVDDILVTAIYLKVTGGAWVKKARRLASSDVKVDYEILTTSTKVINQASVSSGLLAAVVKESKAIGVTVAPTMSGVSAPKTTTVGDNAKCAQAKCGTGKKLKESAKNTNCPGGVTSCDAATCCEPVVIAAKAHTGKTTCKDLRDAYAAGACCFETTKEVGSQIVPDPPKSATSRLAFAANPCAGKKPSTNAAYDNAACFKDGVAKQLEQAGGDVSLNFKGGLNAGGRTPLTLPYFKQGLCPVNVHWHVGAEHRSNGQYDENGKSPALAGARAATNPNAGGRRLAAGERYGFACHHFNAADAKFTKKYDWKHCIGMHVGETYEVHWPHSKLGACHTPFQFQSPFYDGVFCTFAVAHANAIAANAQVMVDHVGVQAQVFTIVNDEKYYYPKLMNGAIVDGDFWKDVAAYTGSTTGTSRSNTVCSAYTPITWQVDRKCHLISASSFDKMCADMKQNPDDMSSDLHAHGARELVLTKLTADNMAKATRR